MEISKRGIEGVTWFFLTPDSKIWGGKKDLKLKLLSKKKLEIKDLEKSQPIHMQKLRKLEKNTKGVTKWLLDKEISMGVNHRLYQLPPQENCQF